MQRTEIRKEEAALMISRFPMARSSEWRGPAKLDVSDADVIEADDQVNN